MGIFPVHLIWEGLHPSLTLLHCLAPDEALLFICPVVIEGGALNHRNQGLQMLWMILKGNSWLLKYSSHDSGSFGALSRRNGVFLPLGC